MYDYPAPIQKVIYTTNLVKGVHLQFQKVTKTKRESPLLTHDPHTIRRILPDTLSLDNPADKIKAEEEVVKGSRVCSLK